MWGVLTKVGAWAWAHKKELAAGWELYRKLRAKRVKHQKPDETAKDYYARVGKVALQDALDEMR